MSAAAARKDTDLPTQREVGARALRPTHSVTRLNVFAASRGRSRSFFVLSCVNVFSSLGAVLSVPSARVCLVLSSRTSCSFSFAHRKYRASVTKRSCRLEKTRREINFLPSAIEWAVHVGGDSHVLSLASMWRATLAAGNSRGMGKFP